MPDLGLNVLFKGKNLARLLGGLGVALKISLLSVVISIVLGIVVGLLMTWKNWSKLSVIQSGYVNLIKTN